MNIVSKEELINQVHQRLFHVEVTHQALVSVQGWREGEGGHCVNMKDEEYGDDRKTAGKKEGN